MELRGCRETVPLAVGMPTQYTQSGRQQGRIDSHPVAATATVTPSQAGGSKTTSRWQQQQQQQQQQQ
jgi:hypothetical protein